MAVGSTVVLKTAFSVKLGGFADAHNADQAAVPYGSWPSGVEVRLLFEVRLVVPFGFQLPQVVYDTEGIRWVRDSTGGAYVDVVVAGETEVAVLKVSDKEYPNDAKA